MACPSVLDTVVGGILHLDKSRSVMVHHVISRFSSCSNLLEASSNALPNPPGHLREIRPRPHSSVKSEVQTGENWKVLQVVNTRDIGSFHVIPFSFQTNVCKHCKPRL